MAVTVTLIILILVLPGCNQKTKRIENTLRVSVVTYTHDDPFINASLITVVGSVRSTRFTHKISHPASIISSTISFCAF